MYVVCRTSCGPERDSRCALDLPHLLLVPPETRYSQAACKQVVQRNLRLGNAVVVMLHASIHHLQSQESHLFLGELVLT